MKKKVLSIATACLFTADIFLSISENSRGQISLIEKSNAVSQNIYQPVLLLCPDEKTTYVACYSGSNPCTTTFCPGN